MANYKFRICANGGQPVFAAGNLNFVPVNGAGQKYMHTIAITGTSTSQTTFTCWVELDHNVQITNFAQLLRECAGKVLTGTGTFGPNSCNCVFTVGSKYLYGTIAMMTAQWTFKSTDCQSISDTVTAVS